MVSFQSKGFAFGFRSVQRDIFAFGGFLHEWPGCFSWPRQVMTLIIEQSGWVTFKMSHSWWRSSLMKLSFWIWTRVPKDLWFWTWDFPSPSEVIESRADCFGTPSWGKRFRPWDCWARSWFGSWWWKLTCIFRSIKWVGWFSGCGLRSICWFTRSFLTRFAGLRGFTRTSSSRMRTFWTKVTWYCLKVF